MRLRDAEKLDRAPQARDEEVDLLLGIIVKETRAGRAGEAEFAHERLVAVMAAAEAEAIVVGKVTMS